MEVIPEGIAEGCKAQGLLERDPGMVAWEFFIEERFCARKTLAFG